MISQFTLKCQKTSECLKYGKTIWRPGLCPRPRWGSLQGYFCTTFYNKYFVDSSSPLTLWLHSIMFGSCLLTIADQMCFWYSVANYDWKHLENSKIGLENSWNFFIQNNENPEMVLLHSTLVILVWVSTFTVLSSWQFPFCKVFPCSCHGHQMWSAFIVLRLDSALPN